MRFHNLGAYAQSLGREQIWAIQRKHPVMFPVLHDLTRVEQKVIFEKPIKNLKMVIFGC